MRYIERDINQSILAKAITFMHTNITNGKTIYLAFSKWNFNILIFTLAIGTAANVALIYILINGTGYIYGGNAAIVTFQLIFSGLSILSGVWLFFKGINIIAE